MMKTTLDDFLYALMIGAVIAAWTIFSFAIASLAREAIYGDATPANTTVIYKSDRLACDGRG